MKRAAKEMDLLTIQTVCGIDSLSLRRWPTEILS